MSAGMGGAIERCRMEVLDLHELFEGWFRGEVEPEEPGLSRLDAVLAPDDSLDRCVDVSVLSCVRLLPLDPVAQQRD